MRKRFRTGEQEQGAAEHIADGSHDGVRLAGTVVIVGVDALRGFGSEIFAEIAILLATISPARRSSDCACQSTTRWWWRPARCCSAASCCCRSRSSSTQPWTLHPTPTAIVATVVMGIVSSALALMLFYICLGRLGTLTTNAQGYMRIPIGVGLSVLLLGESVLLNLALGLLLVMAGVAAMTVPAERLKLR